MWGWPGSKYRLTWPVMNGYSLPQYVDLPVLLTCFEWVSSLCECIFVCWLGSIVDLFWVCILFLCVDLAVLLTCSEWVSSSCVCWPANDVCPFWIVVLLWMGILFVVDWFSMVILTLWVSSCCFWPVLNWYRFAGFVDHMASLILSVDLPLLLTWFACEFWPVPVLVLFCMGMCVLQQYTVFQHLVLSGSVSCVCVCVTRVSNEVTEICVHCRCFSKTLCLLILELTQVCACFSSYVSGILSLSQTKNVLFQFSYSSLFCLSPDWYVRVLSHPRERMCFSPDWNASDFVTMSLYVLLLTDTCISAITSQTLCFSHD